MSKINLSMNRGLLCHFRDSRDVNDETFYYQYKNQRFPVQKGFIVESVTASSNSDVRGTQTAYILFALLDNGKIFCARLSEPGSKYILAGKKPEEISPLDDP